MMLGDLLKAWRQKHDLSVRDAAPQFGVSAATLSRLENGRPIDAATQLRLIVMLFKGEADVPDVPDVPVVP